MPSLVLYEGKRIVAEATTIAHYMLVDRGSLDVESISINGTERFTLRREIHPTNWKLVRYVVLDSGTQIRLLETAEHQYEGVLVPELDALLTTYHDEGWRVQSDSQTHTSGMVSTRTRTIILER